ncbi:MAG TPA: phosphate signaling complex protein PhoU [bacterium]|jgi:phosphate transport system protein|nr:phosphate signaling complex protein PhoU [bacterium]HNT66152.1 phosphate signaling complex protein PhoU [bacterium]HOX87081.1 phosphate signaling complex protein PhoU [bacterium]HPG46412.1 phosphate signaling complex protein PhoU [bacterium]HPM98675.1 phosphate signaling complex protein PhoU [bacterium]
MQNHFNQELANLKKNIQQMAELVDVQLEFAMQAMQTGNLELCKFVRNRDREIDAYDNLIQAQCENIIALFQPVAGDLRFIMTSLMINSQLERCGDIAVNIVKRVQKTLQKRDLLTDSGIQKLGSLARSMARDAIEAFMNNNLELAGKVIARDDEVDQQCRNTFHWLIDKMQSDAQLVEPGAHLIVLSRQLERLADHATNIAEDVIFLIEARIVAHQKK